MLGRMTHRRIVAIDVLVIAWVLLCLGLGIAVTKRINQLGAFGDGLVNAGESIGSVGDWVAILGDVPLLGGGIDAIAERIDDLAASTVEQGEAGKEAVWRTALGVGVLLTLLPTLPVLAYWVPVRVSLERERASLRAALLAGDPGVWEYLSRQAADDMPYRKVRAITEDPWEDVRHGRHEALARAEIDRLGLTFAAGDPPTRG
jgi:hypothetical protein